MIAPDGGTMIAATLVCGVSLVVSSEPATVITRQSAGEWQAGCFLADNSARNGDSKSRHQHLTGW
jgi:hypothetical protein